MKTNGDPSQSAWNRYDKWNSAIAQVVFGEHAAGQPVYLDLEADILARIAKDAGCRVGAEPDEELIEVVKATLSPADSSTGVFGGHIAQAFLWELGGSSKPPPCIAVLAVLSLVAEQMKQTEEFAGSNYYGRLLQMLDINREIRDRVEREFRKETPSLWNTLNRWLEECNGRRGLPTAVAFDRRRYIGLPLSQALIRAQDRVKLPIMFTQFGLQPGQRLSVQAMQQLLEDWLPRSQVTQSLKRLWSKRPSRERISEVACAELEGWDGTLSSEDRAAVHKHHDSLFLAAELRAHPRRTIELILVTRQRGHEDSRLLALTSEASGTAHAALGRLGEEMRLQLIPGTSWESIEPSHLVSCPELLIANVSVADPAGSVTYARRAKRLILLKRHEGDNLFIEARRAELLETYLILVASDFADSARKVLKLVARGGYRELAHDTLRGLPRGWTAFQNVQLERVPSTSIEDLRPLKPLARTHLALGAGLPLPGMNVWHSNRLPELRVVVDEHNGTTNVAHVRAVPIRYLDDREVVDVLLAEVEGAGIVDLSGISALRDGDFRIVVTCPPKGRTVATAVLRARSGSWPRRLLEGEKPLIGHEVLNQRVLAPFGRSVVEPDHETIGLVGALLNGRLPPLAKKPAETSSPMPAQPGVLVEELENDEWDLSDRIANHGEEDLPICFQRAHHIWLCPETLGKLAGYMVCKDCGLEQWWDPRRKRRTKKRAPDTVTQDEIASASRHQSLPTISEEGKADMELVLDALSYAKTGSWRSLRSITAPIDDAPWFAHEATRRLEALGHIQLEIDDKNILPKRWSIAPSTIVEPELGPCFLAGSRSARLIQAVSELVEVLEGEVHIVPQPNGPKVVEIHRLETEELTLLVEEINEKGDLELALSIRPASRIAAMLPSLSTIRRSLPELTTTAARLERLDLSSGRWVSADQMDQAGAYRLRSRPWVYAVVPKPAAREQRSVVADVRLAKHLAASDASFALVGYDELSRTLLASAGAPLPGLLERAAVLCSGRLPTQRPDRTLAYERVPLEIAEAIWAAFAIGD